MPKANLVLILQKFYMFLGLLKELKRFTENGGNRFLGHRVPEFTAGL